MPYEVTDHLYRQYDSNGNPLPPACVTTSRILAGDFELALDDEQAHEHERAIRRYAQPEGYINAVSEYSSRHPHHSDDSYSRSSGSTSPVSDDEFSANVESHRRVLRESPHDDRYRGGRYGGKLHRQLEEARTYRESIRSQLATHDLESNRGSERRQGTSRDVYDVAQLVVRSKLWALHQEAEKWVRDREYELGQEWKKADRLEEEAVVRDCHPAYERRVRFLLEPVD
ncbi:hypothetical protein LTR85_002650 [Meristemomyces frigidus]|nr:hypothetical protein LTR85_002650 [Meristemomyces frigidus]